MAAVDRIPFLLLATSEELRKGWAARGLRMPSSEGGVHRMVLRYGEEVEEEIKLIISRQKAEGLVFSVTLDEWTSPRNRRYMGINLHDSQGKAYGIGMLRITGAFTAEAAARMVKERLEKFGLDLSSDIFGITTDGASTMVKMGKLLQVCHQLCHCHGMHLAVTKILYRKDEDVLEEEPMQEGEQSQEEESEEEEEEDKDEDETRTQFASMQWEEELPGAVPELEEAFKPTIDKIRKIAKLFKRSPKSNDLLHETCKAEKRPALGLILDTKTRWNSLLAMLDRFLDVKSVVAKVLVDMSKFDLYPSEGEIRTCEELVRSLKVVEKASLSLGRRDCSLEKSEKIFEFLFTKLQEQEGRISQDLLEALEGRIKERRLSEQAALLYFLEEPSSYSTLQEESTDLIYPSKNELAKVARDIYVRLFQVKLANPDPQQDKEESEEEKQEEDEPEPKVSKEDDLDLFLQKKKKKSVRAGLHSQSSVTDVLKAIKREIAVLEASEHRPLCLEKIYKALKTLQPSSVEAERSFSSAGLFVTKLRTNLSDKSLNNLFILKSHFLNEKK